MVIVQEHLPSFRIPFYRLLRKRLAESGVELRVIYASNQRNTFRKGELEWAEPVEIHRLGPFAWQPVLGMTASASLVVVQQEIKYLVNPLLQLRARLFGGKVAYWGHGRNFQKLDDRGVATLIRKFLSTKVFWWFAYNDLCVKVVRDMGFPAKRITSVGNAVDTESLQEKRRQIDEARIAEIRAQLGTESENIAIYVGGLYSKKRIPFLIEACQAIRSKISDFELLVIGDGPDVGLVREASVDHPWIRYLGPMDAESAVPFWRISSIALMPGLVGLVVVDSFALRVPLVTTDYPFHSPEFDYLKNGENGILVRCGDSAEAYAEAAIGVLSDPCLLGKLRDGASDSAACHTIEHMADNFTQGVLEALSTAHT